MVSNSLGCLLNAHRCPLLVIVAALIPTLGFQPMAFGNPQVQGATAKQIEVRLIPKKKSIKVGGVLQVRVEIWNVGYKSLLSRTPFMAGVYHRRYPCGSN
jgi:hypothetical protein